ncbi:TetR/AcrR family transcriptional regulator [Jannaschia seohaensis]|uniref:AcrR family transcriptional regulator n=1 Tax=Jannaschia seohaensis TaxID=475081 RepID=A0A2Y9ATX8_9RHOB|nr:TetR/AcrR family transcriptional regulator [Jannaschia seohaensis]PWJ17402.1 AcrR family transcriptional regulator [Jannaschia seohaensis]SSA47465.1 DNA-binding transcriptional regulator, AcrR family [Jannaschia seohaensis]
MTGSETRPATADRRAALRARLIELATARIAAEGLGALKARSLAAEAGCSVGAIYNVFGDLDDLVLAVNGETFRALGAQVTAAVAKHAEADPAERMIVMSEAYLAYATENPLLWRALFDVNMRVDGDVPEWYLAALDRLLAIIDAPLAEVFPDLPPEEIRVRTRALFSSIHGITLLGLERRISAVGQDRLSDMIRYIITSATRPGAT